MRNRSQVELGLAVFLIACKVGGTGDEDEGSAVEEAIAAGRAACDRYLECAAATSPETVGALLAGYGPEGTCWQTDEIAAIELCAQACAAGRANVAELFPAVGACGECASDDDCADAKAGPRCDGKTSSCVACLEDPDCAGGGCKPETHECVECVDDEHCGAGEVCAANTCGPPQACAPGTRRCDFEDGAVLEVCDAEGQAWEVMTDCDAGGLSCHVSACGYTDYGPCTESGACSVDYDECIAVGSEHGYCINEFDSCLSSLDCPIPKPDSLDYERRCIAQVCSLGCENGATCPPGMDCVDGTCAWPR